MSLQGKRIVLLGGTSGLGMATAQAAAEQGASVVVVSSRRERVDAALARLPKGAAGDVVDLRSEDDVRALFERIGAFDHLVYTAGEALQFASVEGLSFADARAFFELRFWAAFTAAKYAAPMIRPGGSIVLTNGTIGRRPVKGWSVTASIAGALEALTRALAVELAPIRVNCVCPGFVRTEMWHAMPEAEREDMFRTAGAALPTGRVGEASDLAQTYLYLMREGFSTGQVLVVDGGGVLV
ncbi:MAG TPA: SDR family oxidoreductase [Candidatus Limnocylindria bacterium]|nr:SDR family oxidoreductase [Candidatus Limnocylindria bacterium]